MANLKGACIIGHSGGPTSVINASALGVIQAAQKSEDITRVLCASHGVKGILKDDIFDVSHEDPKELELLRHTPSSALGSCRYKLADPEDDDRDYRRILEVFKKYDIRYFFYNGGNDSMDTCSKISKYLVKEGYECRVMGIPKTIDNDLFGTDHCPGYGSAAKYIATACMEIYHDATVYDKGAITVLEIMGRNSGWLTASAAIATEKGCGPDLIYLPELPFDLARFLSDINKVYKEKGNCIAAVSEGIKDEEGRYISDYSELELSSKDAFGHKQLGGLAHVLANILREHTNAKVRGIEFSLLQRCAAHSASKTDIEEAYMAGKVAVESALAGVSDKMVAFERSGPCEEYKCETKLVDLSLAANTEKKLPLDWINIDGNGLNEQFLEYVKPLIQGEVEIPYREGMPVFAKLKKIKA